MFSCCSKECKPKFFVAFFERFFQNSMNKSLHCFWTAQQSDLKFFMFMKVLVIISSLFSEESQNVPKISWSTSSCVWASAAKLPPSQQRVIAHQFFLTSKVVYEHPNFVVPWLYSIIF